MSAIRVISARLCKLCHIHYDSVPDKNREAWLKKSKYKRGTQIAGLMIANARKNAGRVAGFRKMKKRQLYAIVMNQESKQH